MLFVPIFLASLTIWGFSQIQVKNIEATYGIKNGKDYVWTNTLQLINRATKEDFEDLTRVAETDPDRFTDGEFLQEVQNLCADGNIESRDWLVGNDEFRFHYNGTGGTASLTLSAGKLVGIPCQVLREQADILCDLFDLGHSVLLILVEMEVIKAFGDYVFNGGTLIQ